MGNKFSARSENNLVGVHPDLVAVARYALLISPVDFGVIDGARTPEEEKHNVEAGASETMNSMHIPGKDGYSHAIDIMAFPGGVGSWDVNYYKQIAESFKTVSASMSVKIVWGGDWTTLKDYGHFELDRKAYPRA